MSATAIASRPNSGSLYDVVDVILDKGLVIDAFVRVSLVGIELLTVDARIVVASVDTYLHFAEAVDRLDLTGRSEPKTLPGLFSDGSQDMARSKTKGALEGGFDKLKETFGSGEGEKEKQKQEAS